MAHIISFCRSICTWAAFWRTSVSYSLTSDFAVGAMIPASTIKRIFPLPTNPRPTRRVGTISPLVGNAGVTAGGVSVVASSISRPI